MKEFNKIFALGLCKVSFLNLIHPCDQIVYKTKSCAETKYENFISNTISQIRLPLIKAKPIESLEEFDAKHII